MRIGFIVNSDPWQKCADGGFIPSRDMAGAQKWQPQASGAGEKSNRAAHGASTESGLLPNAAAQPRAALPMPSNRVGAPAPLVGYSG
jgi:hypothetical protein